MSRNTCRWVPRWLWLFAGWRQLLVAAGWLWASSVLAAPVSGGGGRQVRSGQVPRLTRQLPALGRLDASYHLEVAIGLPLRHREELTNLLADIYNPASPNFRHFLKPEAFAATDTVIVSAG